MHRIVKINKAKLKISSNGIFGIVGIGNHGETKDLLIDRVDVADVVDYVKIEPEYFEIKLVNNDKIHVVYWRNLSENPSVPSRIVMKNKSRDNILFFLYDIIAEFAYDGARDKGMPHDSTIERLKEMYPSYKTYCRDVSLKYLGCQILSNYK